MANKTLLNATNEILKRVNELAGDSAALTSLTDAAHQHAIDLCVQIVNEGIDELYSASSKALPTEQKEGTITLVASTREYSLASDIIQLRWPLIDKTNSQFIFKYPGEYDDMLVLDPEQDDTGLPHFAAISPVNAKLHMDRAPTSTDNGKVYTYQYDRDLVLSGATDQVPFNNMAFRAMVPAWVQLYKRERRNEFDQALYQINIGRAARAASMQQPRGSYSARVATTAFKPSIPW